MDELDFFKMEEDMDYHNDLSLYDGREELDFDQGKDFIVSIHSKREKSCHCGCGVIVGNYLVTAGHVAKEKTTGALLHNIFVRFKSTFIELKDDDIVYDGRQNEDADGVHDDLIIYRFKEVSSPFCLNNNELTVGLCLCAKTFDYDGHIDDLQSVETVCEVFSLQSSSSDNKNKWSNCFVVNNPSTFKEGNSGCPVYRKQDVYGILLKDKRCQNSDRCYTFLSAGYIIQKINEFEHQL